MAKKKRKRKTGFLEAYRAYKEDWIADEKLKQVGHLRKFDYDEMFRQYVDAHGAGSFLDFIDATAQAIDEGHV